MSRRKRRTIWTSVFVRNESFAVANKMYRERAMQPDFLPHANPSLLSGRDFIRAMPAPGKKTEAGN
mgnify:CR=1 FL=1